MAERQWLEAHFAEVRPRALALLTRHFNDLDLAEDAFSQACVNALRAWPRTGIPDNPLAWLLTVARNAARDMLRRRASAQRTSANLAVIQASHGEDEEPEAIDQAGLRDDVLRLLFICCHPDLSAQDQSALALRVVAGLSVAQIAGGFVVKPRAMEQRLTRAKRLIAARSVPFEPPSLDERHRRLNTVMLMIYLMFNEGWSAISAEESDRQPLCQEAIRLARLLMDLFPSLPELMGLLALFLFQYARRAARFDAGRLLRLDEQPRDRWDHEMIAEAATLLEKALRHSMPGSYQIQAAIASVHARAATSEDTDWDELLRLYEALLAIEPTAIVRLNHAAVVAHLHGPAAGLGLVEPLAGELGDYRWYHTMRGGLLCELGRWRNAREAYRLALTLTPTAAERLAINEKIAACESNLAKLSD